MKTKTCTQTLLAGAAALLISITPAGAAETIKVGVLHSLSGTMAISETTLKDTVLMLIDEQNKKGGLLGKKLEAVVVDPASNWPLFAEKARQRVRSSTKRPAALGAEMQRQAPPGPPAEVRAAPVQGHAVVQGEATGRERRRNFGPSLSGRRREGLPSILLREEVRRLLQSPAM